MLVPTLVQYTQLKTQPTAARCDCHDCYDCHVCALAQVNIDTQEVRTIGGHLPEMQGLNKWEGGVVAEDGALYCMPMVAKRVLRIDGAALGEGKVEVDQDAM